MKTQSITLIIAALLLGPAHQAIAQNILYDNGPWNGRHGYSISSPPSARRSILEDFELPPGGGIIDAWSTWMIWNTLQGAGHATKVELTFYGDANGFPDFNDQLASVTTTDITEVLQGSQAFGRDIIIMTANFPAVFIPQGRAWVDMIWFQPTGENSFMLSADLNFIECWTDYEDFPPPGPGTVIFGLDTDMQFVLYGTAGNAACLNLTVDNLFADQQATFTISGGTPGAKAITVYGRQPGSTVFNNIAGYCATFGINGVTQNRIIGGIDRTFDANGEITFTQSIPRNTGGTTIFFQSAERGTCPDECMSNLVETTVQQLFKLLASDGAARDRFASSLAVSGNLAVIGADGDDGSTGSAYVFDLTTGQQLFKLLASKRATLDNFGISTAISGNLAVIGAIGDDDNGADSGAAYVFDVTTGRQLFKLLASDGEESDHFGISVAVSGNLAVIGANRDNDNGTHSGSAYVFDVTTGRQLLKLLPADGTSFDNFAGSAAMSGNLAVIGADNKLGSTGSAYVFDVTTGQQLFKLLAADRSGGDMFGSAVSVSGNLAVIGARRDDDNGDASGSAYVFDITTGQQLFKLLASDGAVDDFFGRSVAVNGNVAMIGATGNDDHGASSGSAYIFDVTTGRQLFKLLAADGVTGDLFGNSVAFSGNQAVIGAIFDDDNGETSGSAYIFE